MIDGYTHGAPPELPRFELEHNSLMTLRSNPAHQDVCRTYENLDSPDLLSLARFYRVAVSN